MKQLIATDPELCQEIQAIASELFIVIQEMKTLFKEEWWLYWSISLDNRFVDVIWARMEVFSDLSVQVFDMDGRTMYFEDEAAAANELLEDEYSRLNNLDEEDEQDLGVFLADLQPPAINEKQDLKPLMKVRFQRKL